MHAKATLNPNPRIHTKYYNRDNTGYAAVNRERELMEIGHVLKDDIQPTKFRLISILQHYLLSDLYYHAGRKGSCSMRFSPIF